MTHSRQSTGMLIAGIMMLAACASRPQSHPIPRSVWDLPECIIKGERGVWLCDVAPGGRECDCVSQLEWERWKQRNGL